MQLISPGLPGLTPLPDCLLTWLWNSNFPALFQRTGLMCMNLFLDLTLHSSSDPLWYRQLPWFIISLLSFGLDLEFYIFEPGCLCLGPVSDPALFFGPWYRILDWTVNIVIFWLWIWPALIMTCLLSSPCAHLLIYNLPVHSSLSSALFIAILCSPLPSWFWTSLPITLLPAHPGSGSLLNSPPTGFRIPLASVLSYLNTVNNPALSFTFLQLSWSPC